MESKTKKRIFSVALVGLVLAGTAAVALAQESSPSPSPEGNRQEKLRKLREGRGAKLRPGAMVLHSDGVAVRRDGTTFEFRTQKGIIREVSATSITIESPDDYVQTYRIDGDTVIRDKRERGSAEDLKAGDVASIRAEKSGSDYLAKHVHSGGEPGPRLKELLDKASA